MRRQPHKYTKSELEFLKQNGTMPRRELAELFNKVFGANVTYAAIRSKCKVLGLKTGRKVVECHEYTADEIEFLKEHGATPRKELTAMFNKQFATKISVFAIQGKCTGLGLRTGRKVVDHHEYTTDEVEFLKSNETMPRQDLTNLFNSKFGLDISSDGIKAKCLKLGLKTGRDGRIKKGDVSWNKGVKGVCGTHPNCKAAHFRKGHVPANTKGKGVGHERITNDGYIMICTEQINPHTGAPRHYVPKHKWIWEKHNGPIPPNHCLRFKDGDKTNCEDIDNLILITRAENAVLNIKGLGDACGDLFMTALAAVKLEIKANKIARNLKQ